MYLKILMDPKRQKVLLKLDRKRLKDQKVTFRKKMKWNQHR